MRRVFATIRLTIALIGIIALVGDFFYTLGFRAFQIDNFFAYFTTQSNIAGVVVLLLSGLVGLAREWEPPWLSTTRALVLSYIIVSGIVFGLIAAESGSRNIRVDIPWSSATLHFVIPVLAIAEWIFGPGRRTVPWKVMWLSLAFPVVWGVATLARGAAIGWYPYFFLDPSQVSGWPEFIMYDAIVLGLISGLTAFVIALSRVRPLGPRALAPRSSRAGSSRARSSRAGSPRARSRGPAQTD